MRGERYPKSNRLAKLEAFARSLALRSHGAHQYDLESVAARQLELINEGSRSSPVKQAALAQKVEKALDSVEDYLSYH